MLLKCFMEINNFIRNRLVRGMSFFTDSDYSKAIFYHDIHKKRKFTEMSTSIEQFKNHINLIRDLKFNLVPSIVNQYKEVEISFDDGFLGLYENINLLKELDLDLQIFITTSFLGKQNYIDKIKLEELSRLSFIKISSHTHTHRALNNLSEKDLREDLIKSKDILESIRTPTFN